MHISELRLSHFRNIEEAHLTFSNKFNFIFGENGSGKTSLLETIYLLSTAQSFKTRHAKNYIRFGEDALFLFGRIGAADGEATIGLTKSKVGKTQVKIDDVSVQSAQNLSAIFPTHIFYAGSFKLLEGGPRDRRAFIDWLVFHVKHSYRYLWADFERCLKNRNALLRREKLQTEDLAVWDQQFCELGESISALRQEITSVLLENIADFSLECGLDPLHLRIVYKQGWDTESLSQSLSKHFERDRALGYTSQGPHKADLSIEYKGRPIEEILSRGQLKTFIIGLHAARIQSFKQSLDCFPVLLFDDIVAELDSDNQGKTLNWLSAFDTQVFITSVDTSVCDRVSDPDSRKMFHVKHGVFTEHNNT